MSISRAKGLKVFPILSHMHDSDSACEIRGPPGGNCEGFCCGRYYAT